MAGPHAPAFMHHYSLAQHSLTVMVTACEPAGGLRTCLAEGGRAALIEFRRLDIDMLAVIVGLLCLQAGVVGALAAATEHPAATPRCSPLLQGYGLHAHDDLAFNDSVASAEACCDLCATTPECVAFTLMRRGPANYSCRAKGEPALLNSSRTPCKECVSGFLVESPPAPPAPRPAGLRNILLVVVDDLRPQMSPYGQAETVTPNLDAFSKGALVFDRAYCQQAVCSPSRNSFLSGRRPDATKAWNFLTHFREVGPDWTTMPEYFLKAGWFVAGTGKVYHPGLPPNNDPPSWSQPYSNQGQRNPSCPPCPPGATWCGNSWCSLNETQNAGNNDEWIASDGQRLLSLAAAQPKPFFVAVRTATRLHRRARRGERIICNLPACCVNFGPC